MKPQESLVRLVETGSMADVMALLEQITSAGGLRGLTDSLVVAFTQRLRSHGWGLPQICEDLGVSPRTIQYKMSERNGTGDHQGESDGTDGISALQSSTSVAVTDLTQEEVLGEGLGGRAEVTAITTPTPTVTSGHFHQPPDSAGEPAERGAVSNGAADPDLPQRPIIFQGDPQVYTESRQTEILRQILEVYPMRESKISPLASRINAVMALVQTLATGQYLFYREVMKMTGQNADAARMLFINLQKRVEESMPFLFDKKSMVFV